MREALRAQHIEPALRNVYHNIRVQGSADVVIIVYRCVGGSREVLHNIVGVQWTSVRQARDMRTLNWFSTQVIIAEEIIYEGSYMRLVG